MITSTVAVLFCRECGSHRVDVNHWTDDGAQPVLRCYECGTSDRVTVGRVGLGDADLDEARKDRASFKHRPASRREARGLTLDEFHERRAEVAALATEPC